MSHTLFNWDEFFSKASFNKIRQLSPDLASRRPPSTYSPDRKLLYLSSQDYCIETSNQDQLLNALDSVKNTYAAASRSECLDHAKAYVARIDFIELCQLLVCCADNPEEFSDPDGLLGAI
jgi:hypothetical protein